MKTSKYHIICSWILLTCFVAGQYMVYAHQHNVAKSITKSYSILKSTPQQLVGEKCRMCDVMAHNTMVSANQVYASPAVVVPHIFKVFGYNFSSFQLIHSGGRAPPSSIS